MKNQKKLYLRLFGKYCKIDYKYFYLFQANTIKIKEIGVGITLMQHLVGYSGTKNSSKIGSRAWSKREAIQEASEQPQRGRVELQSDAVNNWTLFWKPHEFKRFLVFSFQLPALKAHRKSSVRQIDTFQMVPVYVLCICALFGDPAQRLSYLNLLVSVLKIFNTQLMQPEQIITDYYKYFAVYKLNKIFRQPFLNF